MPKITNFTEAQDALRPYYNYSHTAYTLDAMRGLMAYLDNPQHKLKVVHVAGTSGKTSTSYYSAALLHASGATVGLFISPHVDNVNERLQINGQPAPEAEFCAVLSEFLELLQGSPIKPSYFELLAAMAYWDFARRSLDYAVMEVGLGGLLDATNVVESADKICLITDIGLDHTEILGDTIAKIAFQKAGIMQPGNQAFAYDQGPEVMTVFVDVAQKQHAQLQVLTAQDIIQDPSLPLFQQRNLGLAVAAITFANQCDGRPALSPVALQAVAGIVVPARLERIQLGGKTIIIDGSHNQQKIQALLLSIEQLYPGQSIAALVGFVKGNQVRWQGGLSELLPTVKHIIFTSFHGEQDMPKSSVAAEDLAVFTQAQNYHSFTVANDPTDALRLLQNRSEDVLLITGSFYLLNHIRPLIMGQL